MEADTHAANARLHRAHADARASRRGKWFVVIFVVTVVSFSALNVWMNLRQETLPDELPGVTRYDNLESQVVTGPVDYDMHPPAGGAHDELPQLCGLYRVPVVDEHAVASLATGVVWIAYRQGLPADDVDMLWKTGQGELDVLISPYPNLSAPIVVTAWGRQMAFEDAADERIAMFVSIYQNRDWAPLVDERCSRGVGPGQP